MAAGGVLAQGLVGCREGWSSVEGCRWGVPGAPTEWAGRRRAGACGLRVGAVGVGVRAPAPAGGGRHAACGPCPRATLQTVAPLGSGAGPSPARGCSGGCLRTDWPSRRCVGRQSQGGPGSHCRDRSACSRVAMVNWAGAALAGSSCGGEYGTVVSLVPGKGPQAAGRLGGLHGQRSRLPGVGDPAQQDL